MSDEALRALEKKWRDKETDFAAYRFCADELAAILSARQEVAPVAGPWESTVVGNKIVVVGDYFGTDVWLYVTGDFINTETNLEYANRIAQILNKDSPAQTSEARDAARYRWFRDRLAAGDCVDLKAETADELDAAIDAAMRQEAGK